MRFLPSQNILTDSHLLIKLKILTQNIYEGPFTQRNYRRSKLLSGVFIMWLEIWNAARWRDNSSFSCIGKLGWKSSIRGWMRVIFIKCRQSESLWHLCQSGGGLDMEKKRCTTMKISTWPCLQMWAQKCLKAIQYQVFARISHIHFIYWAIGVWHYPK